MKITLKRQTFPFLLMGAINIIFFAFILARSLLGGDYYLKSISDPFEFWFVVALGFLYVGLTGEPISLYTIYPIPKKEKKITKRQKINMDKNLRRHENFFYILSVIYILFSLRLFYIVWLDCEPNFVDSESRFSWWSGSEYKTFSDEECKNICYKKFDTKSYELINITLGGGKEISSCYCDANRCPGILPWS